MLVKDKMYDKELDRQCEKNKVLSENLIQLFDNCSLKNVHMASVGNSISSGYSKCDEMLPLLSRSELFKAGAPISFYSFARVRKNEELNVIKWYKSNISHQQINALLLSDILAKKGKYANFNDEHIESYRKFAERSNIGLNDFVQLNDNIIIYNGLSGTFTDRMRRGSFVEKTKLLSSFKEDYVNLRSLLLQIYLDNPHVQIYVCGLPNLMGAGISNSYDKYIKDAVSTVPNAHYVEGSYHNLLSFNSRQKEMDIHYNRIEYLQLLNRIFSEIIEQYVPTMVKTRVLELLEKCSLSEESICTTNVVSENEIKAVIYGVFEEYGDLIEKLNISKKELVDSIWEYYNTYYLMNYGCTDRKSVKSLINTIKSR